MAGALDGEPGQARGSLRAVTVCDCDTAERGSEEGNVPHRTHQKKLLFFCWYGMILMPQLLPWGLLPSSFLSISALISLERVKNVFFTLMLAFILVSINLIP